MNALLPILATLAIAWLVLRWNDRREMRRARRLVARIEAYSAKPYDWEERQ